MQALKRLFCAVDSCFGKAFEQASKISNSRAIVDSFDSHCKFVLLFNFIISLYSIVIRVFILMQ
jgi:hypothetical protein